MRSLQHPAPGGSISKRVLGYIFLASSLVTLSITAVQFAYDYHQELGEVEETLNLVQTSYLGSLARSLWDMNDAALEIQLNGIRNMPNIRHVEVREKGKDPATPLGADFGTLVRTFPLEHGSDGVKSSLGSLVVVADLQSVYSKLLKKLVLIFLTQLIKTILVSTVIYLIIHRVLTTHLLHIAEYLTSFRPDASEELRLIRKPLPPGRQDELDVLVDTLNQMRSKLEESYAELRRLNAGLEEKVRESSGTIESQRMQIEAASKMSALGEMAGGVAHEINNPVAIIHARAEQLEELSESGELDADAVREAARMIGKTSLRIAKIVKGLRTFSRDGNQDPFESASVQTVIEETLDFCRERFKSNGIEFNVTTPESPVMVECRATQISQVVLNLLGNAYDAVSRLDEKWVRLELISRDERTVEIRVTDSGRGIPPHILGKIMQPFFTTKEVGKGTGLGLSISRGIVQSHGGTLYVDEHDAHTCFVVSLPRVQASRAAA